ncbi:hypothetical protein EGR_07749 [Echinococcus granulosus]|uniref:Uncharacterized protein n=1 Tax=Echinococcus granulosus TaxID=6210 RepID=W6U8B8_ECHGR|nr:hypothetical protein EGR_07749 [Echinococcus granulosus]EUB57425.1 hypothetical protein EGR_07749 [Echinococcus granulosus]
MPSTKLHQKSQRRNRHYIMCKHKTVTFVSNKPTEVSHRRKNNRMLHYCEDRPSTDVMLAWMCPQQLTARDVKHLVATGIYANDGGDIKTNAYVHNASLNESRFLMLYYEAPFRKNSISAERRQLIATSALKVGRLERNVGLTEHLILHPLCHEAGGLSVVSDGGTEAASVSKASRIFFVVKPKRIME